MRLILVFLLLVLAAGEANAELSSSQARKLITRMAGFELPNNSVRIKSISTNDSSMVQATAEIRATFRLAPNEYGLWRPVEVRTGPNRWESLQLLSSSPEIESAASHCDVPSGSNNGTPEPSTKRARCVIAALLGVQLPSDAVRIKNVDGSPFSFGSTPSSVVEALITVEVRFERAEGKSWTVSGLRTGSRDWVDVKALVAAANEEKSKRARADLHEMAQALEKFRSERNAYVVSESHAVLVDHLSPRFLKQVIRLDPWNRPYQYRGDSASFTLRSMGPDGKENTPDDIVFNGPAN
ncbi:MAG TPA: type II secretion system protein GspG [Pyrinomonadaceae bacterium]|nr:type II secretion system protein GspG [Pyrinomonadaceae bacterium]